MKSFCWHVLVRQCRIRSSAEEVGLSDFRPRKHAILDSTQPMVQACGVRETTDILWTTRPRFIAHSILRGGH